MNFQYLGRLVIVSLGLWVSIAEAAIYSYPDQLGLDAMYLDISEDTGMATNALFGGPDVAGNVLDFDPSSFASQSSSSTGTSQSSVVNGELRFTVMSNESSPYISKVIIQEAGDYTLVGLGSAQASAAITASATYTITHANGVALAPAVSGTSNLVFSPMGSFSLPGDSGTGLGWAGSLEVDIAAFAAANNINGNATKVDFVLTNELETLAADGGSAFIAKKDINFATILVPEPGVNVMLSAIGLLCSGLFRRKRR